MERAIRELKGVGEKTEKLLAKLGIRTTRDLLYAFPRDYDQFEKPVAVSELEPGKLQAVCVSLVTNVSARNARNMTVVTAKAADHTGKLSFLWFNMPFLRTTLKRGMVCVFRGKAEKRGDELVMEQPKIYTPAEYEELTKRLQPIYPLTSGITNKLLAKLLRQVLSEDRLCEEYLPQVLTDQYKLMPLREAMEQIHFPVSREQLIPARRRLVYDEFLQFLLCVQLLKEKSQTAANLFPMKKDWTCEKVMEALPYRLTDAQKNTWYQIEQDLASSALMSRLVQGDVGSGKTVVAFLSMIMTAQNGYQAVMMAPTEVLARQHYAAFLKLKEAAELPFEAVVLTGADTAKEKREKKKKIADGSAQIILGTTALIQDTVAYKNLALVICDEQHRFGVKQRESLCTRGNPPHVLVMSATPIPRTLAIILYGELDISVIGEKPAMRLPIKNCVVGTGYRKTAYTFMEKQIREGRQVYVICPMVEDSEGSEGENVLDYSARLRGIFPEEITVGTLHGKMKPKEKTAVMEAFSQGQIQILVSTTVVEVGVDVPNATVMLIENAERFGLAQLHQLRGRVGRGDQQSYCIFMQGQEEEETKKRLKLLESSNDGFFLASEDLKLRGPGDLFGIRQSGALEFRIGDIYNDAAILEAASQTAKELMTKDPQLLSPALTGLRKRVLEENAKRLENLSI